ncbi:hypothetical protein O0L34_g777 [Tuta absoluta]|nr:hypothetical protein O0L34_g3401 [Tuta absoluta]KAJ2953200.1 hypothetical protein O0L34_g777 [Tuta absoluta]
MWVIVCATLVAGALGHFHLHDPRSILSDLETPRQELAYSDYGVPQLADFRVSCPGCKRSSTFNQLSKRCVEEPVKKCAQGHYLTYDEYGCRRRNCYRGLHENCTDANCAPGYVCKESDNYVKTCEINLGGPGYNTDFIPNKFHLNRYRYGEINF